MNDFNQSLSFTSAQTLTSNVYQLGPGAKSVAVELDCQAIAGVGASLAVKAQFSTDAVTWVDDDAYTAITTAAKSRFGTTARFQYMRFSGTLTGTTPTATLRIHAEGRETTDVVDQPSVLNLTLTLADTEYSQVIPMGTRKILLKARSSGSDLKFSFTTATSGTVYTTIPAGSGGLWIECEAAYGLTLYVQSPTAGEIAEILAIK